MIKEKQRLIHAFSSWLALAGVVGIATLLGAYFTGSRNWPARPDSRSNSRSLHLLGSGAKAREILAGTSASANPVRSITTTRLMVGGLALAVASIFYLAQPVFTPAQAAPTLLWAGDAEEASLSDWTSSGGGIFNTGTGNASASTDFARSGSYSAKMSITNASGASQAVRLFRWAESRTNPEAYYSAWYYFPQDYSGMNWWNVFQFKSKLSDTVNDPTFTLNVGNRSGQMFFYLYDHLNGNINRGWSSTAIPVGRWFHLEAFYKQAADNTGRVTFWQDGVQILDLSGVSTRRSGDEIHWSLTNYTDNISPSSATIYVDDAAISTARLSEASSPTATAKPTSPSPDCCDSNRACSQQPGYSSRCATP